MLNSQFKKAEDSPGFLLWQSSMQWQRMLSEALKPLNLTHMQFVLLTTCTFTYLSENKAVTQVQLAQRCRVDVMTTSQVLRTLEKKKFIKRCKSKEDSRALDIFPTEKGRRLTEKAVPIVEAMDEVYFSRIKNRKALMSVLKKLSH
ncbi:MAG: MarR family transcriptional regulator [Chlamydiales bacterium]|nr:MarR family transcriptional regulator [Chlamydiales bacterium]